MADYDSSLPVRTENPGDVISKIADATTPSQQLTVNADGSVNVTDNGGSLTVDGTVTVTATDLDIRDLDAAQDNVAISDGTEQLEINADGSLNAVVSATDLDIRDLDQAQDSVEVFQATHDNLNANANIQVGNADVANGNPVPVSDAGGSLTVDAVDLDIRDLVFATDKVDVSGSSVDVTATDLDIRDLDAAQDNVAISDGTDTLEVNADGSINITDNGGSITVDGTVSVSNFPSTVDTNYGTVGANTIRTASQIGNATGAADFNAGATGAQTLRVEANQGEASAVADAWPVLLTDGTDTVAVNADGSLNVVISDGTPGTPVNDFNTAAALASGATSNHDYTVTAGKILHLNQIEASGSGKMKIEVQVETAVASGTFNTRWVQFSSTAETNMSIHIDNPIAVAAGVRVRVIRTNRDNQAQDVYSTISGYELP